MWRVFFFCELRNGYHIQGRRSDESVCVCRWELWGGVSLATFRVVSFHFISVEYPLLTYTLARSTWSVGFAVR